MTRTVRLWAPGVLISLAGALGFFVILDWVAEQEEVWNLDEPLLEWLAAHREPWLTIVMTTVTWTFGPVVLPILLAVIGLIYGRRTHQWFDVLVVWGSVAVATVISAVAKVLIARPRPADTFWTIPGAESSYSFPSGHTIGASTLVLVTGFLAWRGERHLRVLVWWVVGAVVTISLVGGSRLYLGYHFLTDVLAGVCVGIFVLGIAVVVVRLHDERRLPDAVDRLDPDAAADLNSP